MCTWPVWRFGQLGDGGPRTAICNARMGGGSVILLAGWCVTMVVVGQESAATCVRAMARVALAAAQLLTLPLPLLWQVGVRSASQTVLLSPVQDLS